MKTLLLFFLAAWVLRAEARPQPAQRFILPNGLTVLLLEVHERPLLRVRLHVSLTGADRSAACPDLPERLLACMDRSDRGGRKAKDFNLELEDQGIQLHDSSSPKGMDWFVLARSRDQDLAMASLSDLLLRCVPDAYAWKNPGGVSWSDLQAFQKRVLRPGNAILVLHGDLGLEQAKRLVLLTFGTWPAASRPIPKALHPSPSPGAQALRALLTPPPPV